MTDRTSAESAAAQPTSPWAPFGHTPFAVLWVATVVSNVGTWMNDVGAGWLMTELSPSPLVVAGVQAATTLPVFLFALLAGAVADIVDRRRMLLVVNGLTFIVVSALAALVALDAMTPGLLLVFTFLIGTGAAFLAPAWQAIVPKLVPREALGSAIALNSMGINVSRAIGPALAGFLIVTVGLWSPFAVNAASFLAILAALWWWRPPPEPARRLPREHVGGAIIAGLRYAANSGPLRATLLRAAAFFAFASAYWAMLPLIARQVLDGGPTLYGMLLASVGAGAVAGALILPALRKRLGPDLTVGVGTLGTALVLLAFAVVPNPVIAVGASGLAGISWIAVLSSLHVSAQTALPDWVRARGLSIFLTVFFGAMSGGSLIWGQVANLWGIPVALVVAAAGALLLIPATWHAKLGQGEALDLAPSGHWPEPAVTLPHPDDRGPVMIQIRYEIAEEDQKSFRRLMGDLARARRRGGAYGWTLMQDAEEPERFVETWFETSWINHLRHHERVSRADRDIQAEVQALHRGAGAPAARHFLALHSKQDVS
ncbi:MFS transporter [Roseobacter sinensis]|uniref:MFS transporter n=1 Tax=Roseobacter sinensis TaxID=2931391 RepID=A0ABT3BJT6_9RHOB|nr:MFS transporter [Roseobacter sp. WL0113]MCV3273473.1 MFS transporter [Roseobacter sp. WL0113]